jgi:formate dehydrogenase major subunit
LTNSYTDIRNSKTLFFLGGNPGKHPVRCSIYEGKELNRANFIVADPPDAHGYATSMCACDQTDIPVLWGMLWHIFKNGWGREFIANVCGMDEIRKEVESGRLRKSSACRACRANSSAS